MYVFSVESNLLRTIIDRVETCGDGSVLLRVAKLMLSNADLSQIGFPNPEHSLGGMMESTKPVSDSKSPLAKVVLALLLIGLTVYTYALILDSPFRNTNESIETRECDSPDDNCPAFQPPQDNPVLDSSINPYEPTADGTEAVDGHVPTGLSIDHNQAEHRLEFRFGGEGQEPFARAYRIPLETEDQAFLSELAEHSNPAKVALEAIELDGISVLTIYQDGLDIEYQPGADADRLQTEVETIIGTSG